MKISVVMPTANRKDHIRGAVESILAQDYTDWELIIKEGASGSGYDAIRDLLADKRITYLYSHDTGISNAVNTALRLVTGELINWANDDDRLYPYAFSEAVSLIGDKKWLYGRIDFYSGPHKVGGMGYRGTLAQLRAGNFIPQPSVFWRRELLSSVGQMDESLPYAQDYDYWIRLMKAHPDYAYSEKPLAMYHFHDDQILKKHASEQSAFAQRIAQTI